MVKKSFARFIKTLKDFLYSHSTKQFPFYSFCLMLLHIIERYIFSK